MRKKLTFLAVAVIAVVAVPSLAQKKASSSDRAIRVADQAWLRAFSAKDLSGSLEFCATNAAVLAPNTPAATGKKAIGELFTAFFGFPDFHINWHPTKVGVARSGELGYSTGSYEMSFKDPSGKAVSDHGKYVTIWQRQGSGKWKVIYDIFNSDLPAAP